MCLWKREESITEKFIRWFLGSWAIVQQLRKYCLVLVISRFDGKITGEKWTFIQLRRKLVLRNSIQTPWGYKGKTSWMITWNMTAKVVSITIRIMYQVISVLNVGDSFNKMQAMINSRYRVTDKSDCNLLREKQDKW